MPAGLASDVSTLVGADLQVPGGGMDVSVFASFFFIIVVIVVVVAFARSASGWSRVQRPMATDTSFPPPPPPDTVTVKCEYCGTRQVWRETCVQCGAPLPKPGGDAT